MTSPVKKKMTNPVEKSPKQTSGVREGRPVILEKVQAATRLGATGLRASEREICL